MGRRKGKRTVFLQRDTLEQEAQLNIHSHDEAGGLHIGGAVIYRAPLSSRRAPGRPARPQQSGSSRPGSGGCFAAQQQHDAEEWQVLRSEDSLDDELREYLDNVEQHGEGSDSEPTTPQQQQSAPEPSAAGTSAQHIGPPTASGGVHAPAQCKGSLDNEDDAGLVSRPGLGYHPGLGFSSSVAAARFTAAGLDDALEGLLGRDLAAGLGCYSKSSGSHTDSSSYTDDDSSSASGSDSDEDVPPEAIFDSNLVDMASAVVVDPQLSLQQRFPVMTRQQQQQGLAAPGLGLANSSSSSRHRSSRRREASKKQHNRTHHHNSSSVDTNSSTPAAASWASSIRMPSFGSAAITAAATAACAAAAEAADASATQRQRDHKLRQQQQRSVIKGARNGQLLPGEKKKLRKEKIAAKRAVRRAEAGCSALELLGVVEEFVAAGGDMTVLPPAGKHKQAFTRALASVFGVKATPRGGSSSGKTCLMLQSTTSTALPSENDGVRLKQLRDLLSAEVARELTAASVAAGHVAGSEQKKKRSRVSQRQGLQQQSSRGTDTDVIISVFQQPVSFVSAGVCDPNDMSAAAAAAQEQQGYVSAAVDTTVAAAAARHPAPEPTSKAADSSWPCSSSSAANDVGTGLAALLLDTNHYQQHQQQQDGDGTAAAGALPADAQITDSKQTQLQPQLQLQQQTPEVTAGSWVVDREAHPAAVVTSAVPKFIQETLPNRAANEAAVSGPMYQRTATGLGFGSGSSSTPGVGLGFVANSGSGMLQTGNAEMSFHPAAAAAAADIGSGSSSISTEDTARQHISSSSKVLQDLECKFSNLRAPGNPHAARRQQWKEHKAPQQAGLHQQQQQEQLERRLSNPDTSVGPAVMAGVGQHDLGGVNLRPYHDLEDEQEDYPITSSMTLGLTAQQVKKAKKKKQRNQRREARAAGVADAPEYAYDAGVGVNLGNVSNNFAGFEAHTTGIGSRLLGRWGWSEGEGLGRARHGRAEPLQAARRPRQLGLGAE